MSGRRYLVTIEDSDGKAWEYDILARQSCISTWHEKREPR